MIGLPSHATHFYCLWESLPFPFMSSTPDVDDLSFHMLFLFLLPKIESLTILENFPFQFSFLEIFIKTNTILANACNLF